jgi:hypothetical protein
VNWDEIVQWSQKGFIASCALVVQLTVSLAAGLPGATGLPSAAGLPSKEIKPKAGENRVMMDTPSGRAATGSDLRRHGSRLIRQGPTEGKIKQQE